MRAFLTLTLLLAFGCSQQNPKPHSATEPEPLGVPLPSEAATALQHGTEFQLFSIDPKLRYVDTDPDGFHGFAVLGSTMVSRTVQTRLFKSLSDGVEASVGAIAACFDPRHGIRVQHDGRIYDFLICFDCLQIYWYTDDESNSRILVSESPLDDFNAVLEEASIEMPDPA